MDGSGASWFDGEFAGCDFGDERLRKRLCMLTQQIEGSMGDSIPLAGRGRVARPFGFPPTPKVRRPVSPFG
ncbi:transposase DNA-binding-containing protein [Acidocella sp.]|uniref:IS4/Tn5 family transposase DNA-binding protein n=1 Tax=Acidocella sp. TaxID=50710 RepID=UPI0017A5F840|nr:hypothetical protein [Acidocella sp.]